MIGMIVDAVAETLRVSTDSIEPPSPVISSVDSEYLRGIAKQDERLVILLALDKVLSGKETESIGAMDKSVSGGADLKTEAIAA